jgi:hypothetical protein
MIDLNNIRPGLNFIFMRHDDGCPALETQRASDCSCDPITETTTQRRFMAAIQQTRQQRRKAEREAEKAIKKAKGASK